MPKDLLRRPPTRRLADTFAYGWIRAKRLARRILAQKATPRQIALGGAVGALIAFTPTFGLQMVLAVAVATWLKCSRFAALVMSYLTNPFSVVPVYTFTYQLGTWLIGHRPALRQMREVLSHLQTGDLTEALAGVFHFGWRLALPLWVGGLAVGFVTAIITYSVMLRLVEGHRLVTEEKRQRRQLRQLERMTMAAGLATTGDALPKHVKLPQPQDRPPESEQTPKDPTREANAQAS